MSLLFFIIVIRDDIQNIFEEITNALDNKTFNVLTMFFLRRYVKGDHQSGTISVAEWEEQPSIMEFITECEMHGEGKYVLFERGKGIRGMRKINEYVVKKAVSSSSPLISETTATQFVVKDETSALDEMLVFAAEEFGADPETFLAVKKNMRMGDLSDDDLMSVLDQMTETKVSSAEDYDSFRSDMKALLKEFRKRATDMSLTDKAEAESKGSGMNFVAGILVGGLGGVAATAYHYKGKMETLEERLAAMESSVKETETRMKKQAEENEKKQRAEEAVRQFDSRMGLDTRFLSTFNSQNGPQNL